ncbi:MAG: hypothetical protein QXN75_00975 [Thermoproteota archaeon]
MHWGMMQKALVEDVKEESSEDKLVSEILEIRNMISMVEKNILKSNSSESLERLESLLRILRLEMVKRTILLANKHGLSIGIPIAPVSNNGGAIFRGPFYEDFSRLEKELDRAYRTAIDMLNNLSRLV